MAAQLVPVVTIASALQHATSLLTDSESPRLDAEILLGSVLACSRAQLLSRAERDLDPASTEQYQQLVTERVQGKPIAYLISEREFWSLPLFVNHHTLIPRPETECLVEHSLTLIKEYGYRTLLDLGTGSGAIAVALASECPDCKVLAIDNDSRTLAVAQTNVERLGLTNVRLGLGNWFEPAGSDRFDLIVANPPYLAVGDPHLLQGDLRFEPRGALVSGSDGLDALRQIIAEAPSYIQPGGCLALEHGFSQGEQVATLCKLAKLEEVTTVTDYSGNERITSGRWPGQ